MGDRGTCQTMQVRLLWVFMAVSSDRDRVLTYSLGLAGLLSGHQDSSCAGLGILASVKTCKAFNPMPCWCRSCHGVSCAGSISAVSKDGLWSQWYSVSQGKAEGCWAWHRKVVDHLAARNNSIFASVVGAYCCKAWKNSKDNLCFDQNLEKRCAGTLLAIGLRDGCCVITSLHKSEAREAAAMLELQD